MDPKEIRELIELISRSNFASFELEGKGFKLKLVKENPGAVPAAGVSAPVAAFPPGPVESVALPPRAAPGAAPAVSADASNGAVTVDSPIVGTFYSASGPGAPPFVEVGSQVKKGQVLCIVEAMKVMNEIESEIDAEVLEVLIANGQPVEFGEPMFRLRPLG